MKTNTPELSPLENALAIIGYVPPDTTGIQKAVTLLANYQDPATLTTAPAIQENLSIVHLAADQVNRGLEAANRDAIAALITMGELTPLICDPVDVFKDFPCLPSDVPTMSALEDAGKLATVKALHEESYAKRRKALHCEAASQVIGNYAAKLGMSIKRDMLREYLKEYIEADIETRAEYLGIINTPTEAEEEAEQARQEAEQREADAKAKADAIASADTPEAKAEAIASANEAAALADEAAKLAAEKANALKLENSAPDLKVKAKKKAREAQTKTEKKAPGKTLKAADLDGVKPAQRDKLMVKDVDENTPPALMAAACLVYFQLLDESGYSLTSLSNLLCKLTKESK